MCKPYQYTYMYWLSIPSTRASKERILVSEVILDIKVMMCKSRLVKDIITKLWCNVGSRKYCSSAPFYFCYNVFAYFANRGIPEIFGVVRKLKLVTSTALDLVQLYG